MCKNIGWMTYRTSAAWHVIVNTSPCAEDVLERSVVSRKRLTIGNWMICQGSILPGVAKPHEMTSFDTVGWHFLTHRLLPTRCIYPSNCNWQVRANFWWLDMICVYMWWCVYYAYIIYIYRHTYGQTGVWSSAPPPPLSPHHPPNSRHHDPVSAQWHPSDTKRIWCAQRATPAT